MVSNTHASSTPHHVNVQHIVVTAQDVEALDRAMHPSPELLHAAREWIFRHSSQPDGDRWTDNPGYLDWAAQNLLLDLHRWLSA